MEQYENVSYFTTVMIKYCFDEHMVLFRPSPYTPIFLPLVAHSSQNYGSHDLSALAARVPLMRATKSHMCPLA